MNNKIQEVFMQRCFDLARNGAGKVSPNPMVGAVLVHDNTIIGEGFHAFYGGPHAEVNAVNSVLPENRPYIPHSTLYVSLEPCCFHGKTPACTSLILEQKIPRVIISTTDHTPEVSGQGVNILRQAGVQVITGILEEQGQSLSRFRNTTVTKSRPYIILKFAQTANGFFTSKEPSPYWITNPLTSRLNHKWRSEIDGILVGTNTAKTDNPSLTNRYYTGKNPTRIVIDRNLELSSNAHLFSPPTPTLIVCEKPDLSINFPSHISLLSLPFDSNFEKELLNQLLVRHNIGILLIEGGAITLSRFIQQRLWDEARVLKGSGSLNDGIKAPIIPGKISETLKIHTDTLEVYFNKC